MKEILPFYEPCCTESVLGRLLLSRLKSEITCRAGVGVSFVVNERRPEILGKWMNRRRDKDTSM